MKALPTLSMISLLLCGCSDDGTRELWKKYDEEKQSLDYLSERNHAKDYLDYSKTDHFDGRSLTEDLDRVREVQLDYRRKILKILRQIDKINPGAKHPRTGDSVFTLMDKYD